MLNTYQEPTIVPHGVYLVKVLRLNKGAAKCTGNPRIHYVFEILEGPHRGKHINKIHMLTSEAAIKQCLKEWSQVGISVSSPENLNDHLDNMRSATYRVTFTSRGSKSCCYLQERIEASGEAC